MECVREVVPGAAGGPAFLAGLSMGGYGALRMGMKWPERFRGVSAHSAITKLEQFGDFVREPLPVGPLPAGEADLLHWARVNSGRLPALRFDCGREDGLFAANVELHEALDGLGVAHVFEELDGGHTWEYWRQHLERTLLFFERALTAGAGTEDGGWRW